MKGCPDLVQEVVVNADAFDADVLVGVDDYFEAMAVQTPTLMADRNIRKFVSRLKAVSPPNMGVPACVEVDTLSTCALNRNAINAWHIKPCPDPPCDITVGWYVNGVIEQLVVECRCAFFESLGEVYDFRTFKTGPACRQFGESTDQETVTM